MSLRFPPTLHLVATLFGATLLAVEARAQPDDSSSAESPRILEARDAFRLGSALAAEGQWSDALAAFKRSSRIKEHPVTTYNIAFCERALGHFARAYKDFASAVDPASPDGAKLPVDFEARAQAYLAELEQRVARVMVSLATPDTSVRVDGHGLEPLRRDEVRGVLIASMDDAAAASPPQRFELWLDPGAHLFVVSRPGHPEVVETHVVAAGASATLGLPSADERSPSKQATTARPKHAGNPATTHPDRTWAFVAFGVGAAGFVASGVFTALTLQLKSELSSECGPRKICPPSYYDDEDRMSRFADYTTAGLVLGGIGAATGTYLWLSASPSSGKPGAARQARARAWFGPSGAGISGAF